MQPLAVVQCPACKKSLPPKGVPKHVSGCPSWDTVIGIPPSDFNWDAHYKRGLYADGLEEGVHWVRCAVCAGRDLRFKRMMDHLKKVHGLTEESYRALYPTALVRIESTSRARKETVRSRYGVDNVFQDPDVKSKSRGTMLVKYGAPTPLQSPVLKGKVAETNRVRYGAENPFASEVLKGKIRETNMDRYGVENPNQSPEIIARRIDTNRQRYGADHYFQTEVFLDDYVDISRSRFGSDHPMQSDTGKQLCFAGVRKTYGVDSVFQLPEIQKRAYESNLANHGGVHSQQCPEVLAKARETWLEKYGTDNPAKVEAVKAKVKEVWMGKYGVPFPPQSLWTNREQSFPNGLEKRLLTLAPAQVVYSGDGSYWVSHKGASRTRNPDFVVLTPEQVQAYRGGAQLNTLRTYAVIETFGDFWHGPLKTGMSREAHKEDVVSYYAKCGLQCLVLWEHEVHKHPEATAKRILKFLASLDLG